MTKITTYNRGIIIDGHADTKQECETITLLCNSLAKDENFKQVAYDDGYAAFERIGKAERLRFATESTNVTVVFDNHIEKIAYGSNIVTTSGGSISASLSLSTPWVVTLSNGYILDSISATNGYVLTKTSDTEFLISTFGDGDFTITLTSKAATVKKSVDLATLSGWSNLSSGFHTIKVVAKGTGYRDSEKSAGVEVTKAAEVYTDCLTFTGETSEFTLKATNKTWDGTLEWSTDHSTWTTLAGTEAMQSVGKKLYLRGKGNTKFYDAPNDKGVQWVLSAKADCSGNIQTLLDWENPPTSISAIYCYYSMFRECTNLTSAPELPATTLSYYCYASMFRHCTNLTSAPELPATTIIDGCYGSMFRECTNLTSAPELPATTLALECYRNMFSECIKLKVNTSSGTKIFTCPSTIPGTAILDMFLNTGGSFTGTPTAGNTYYWTE